MPKTDPPRPRKAFVETVARQHTLPADYVIKGRMPRLPIVLPTPTSRAYALAHGAEANMLPTADIQKWVDTQRWKDAVANGGGPTPSGGLNTLTSPGLTLAPPPVDPGFVPKTADLSQNPYPGYYDTLLGFVQRNMDARPAEFAHTGEVFKANQEAANQQMYNAYQGSRTGADASATALGVDPAVVSAARDLAMRKSQENSDQDLASNLAWLDKMSQLSQQQGQSYLNQYAGAKANLSANWVGQEQQRVADANLQALQALVDASNAAAKAKSSGGGRKGSGGGSSGSGNSTVTQTDVLNTGGADLELYNELARTDPAAAAAYLNMYNLTQGTSGQKMAQGKINDLQSAISYNPALKKTIPINPFRNLLGNAISNAGTQAANIPILAARGRSASASALLPIYQKVLAAMTATSGNQGNPKTTTTIKKTKKTPTPTS